MCEWGTTVNVEVRVPAKLSRTGRERRKTVGIDSCIVPLVEALQPIGTVASCCGHGKHLGNVALADGRELIIAPDFETARVVEKAIEDALDQSRSNPLRIDDGLAVELRSAAEHWNETGQLRGILQDADAILQLLDDREELNKNAERLRKSRLIWEGQAAEEYERRKEAEAERDDWRQRHADMQADRDRVGLECNRYKAVVDAAILLNRSANNHSAHEALAAALDALDQKDS